MIQFVIYMRYFFSIGPRLPPVKILPKRRLKGLNCRYEFGISNAIGNILKLILADRIQWRQSKKKYNCYNEVIDHTAQNCSYDPDVDPCVRFAFKVSKQKMTKPIWRFHTTLLHFKPLNINWSSLKVIMPGQLGSRITNNRSDNVTNCSQQPKTDQ